MDVLLVQIDGLASSGLEAALDAGRMPRLAERLRSGALELQSARVDLPSGTLAFHCGLLYGRSDLVPGTRWWDRRAGCVVDATRPKSVLRFERGVAPHGRGLLEGGSAYGSTLGGGASVTDLSLAALAGPRSGLRRALGRTAGGAWKRALGGSLRLARREAPRWLAALAGRHSGVGRFSPLYHGVAGVLLRELLVELAAADLKDGVPAVLYNFMGHDQLSHHLGPDAPEVQEYLARADEDIERLLTAAERGSRAVALFSDHGQAPARPFRATYGTSLSGLLGDLARTTAAAEPPPARPPLVLLSGNLAHVYFSAGAPLESAGIEAHYPGMLQVLRRHPGIGLAACRAAGGGIAIGTETHLAELASGAEPGSRLGLGEGGPDLCARLGALLAQEDCGDLVLFGAEVDGRLVSFLDQWGCHNGYLAGQLDSFVITGRGLPLQLPGHGLASSLHRQVSRWRHGEPAGVHPEKQGAASR
jgi:hypothetical protein